MERPEFSYRRKPAFISFLPAYIFCFGISFLLILWSGTVSAVVTEQVIERLAVEGPVPLKNLPFGMILSAPFLFYGIRRLLWNLMSSYEIDQDRIRLLTGSLTRKEHFFDISGFYRISFRQNLLETPFGVGCIVLVPRTKGRKLYIRGVFKVKSVVEALRPGLVSFD